MRNTLLPANIHQSQLNTQTSPLLPRNVSECWHGVRGQEEESHPQAAALLLRLLAPQGQDSGMGFAVRREFLDVQVLIQFPKKLGLESPEA